MIVKELIKELKKRPGNSKVYVMIHKTTKKGVYWRIDIPVFENPETWEEDQTFTMISVEEDLKINVLHE